MDNMERSLKLRIVDEKFANRQKRSRRIVVCGATIGFVLFVVCIAGFFGLQSFVTNRINHNPGSRLNGTDFNSVDSEACKDEFNIEEWGKDFDSLVFYQSGWDNDERPVWILELGKLDIRGIIEAKGENTERIDFVGTLAAKQMACSMKAREEKTGKKSSVVIIDFEGYSFYQFTSYSAVNVMLGFVSKVVPLMDYMEYGFFVNVNFLANGLLKILRPAIGEAINKAKIESDKEVWLPAVVEKIPMKYLPPRFGGFQNYTCNTPYCTFYRL